jgi:hypothetical protein
VSEAPTHTWRGTKRHNLTFFPRQKRIAIAGLPSLNPSPSHFTFHNSHSTAAVDHWLLAGIRVRACLSRTLFLRYSRRYFGYPGGPKITISWRIRCFRAWGGHRYLGLVLRGLSSFTLPFHRTVDARGPPVKSLFAGDLRHFRSYLTSERPRALLQGWAKGLYFLLEKYCAFISFCCATQNQLNSRICL